MGARKNNEEDVSRSVGYQERGILLCLFFGTTRKRVKKKWKHTKREKALPIIRGVQRRYEDRLKFGYVVQIKCSGGGIGWTRRK